MSTDLAPDWKRIGGRNPPVGTPNRIIAVTEALLAFVLTHVAYRALKTFTGIGRWDAGTNFTPGAVMIAASLLTLVVFRRTPEAYGLGLNGWARNVSLGLVCSLLLAGIWATGLLVTGIHLDSARLHDPHAPNQFEQVVGLAAIALPGYVAALVLFRSGTRFNGRISPWVGVPSVLVLLSVLPLVAAHYHRPALWLPALGLFFGSGFGEEIFFRGYIQSRVDQSFGCPVCVAGFEFGPGLLVSSLLFGLIHALNTVDYFHGRFDFGWTYGVEAFAEGIVYGLIRAKTGSVLPGAITHGLLDAFFGIPAIVAGG